MAGFGDIVKLMSHAKELKAAAEAMKNELPKMEFSSTAANGGVTVTVGGDMTVRRIVIAPEMKGDTEFLAQELQDCPKHRIVPFLLFPRNFRPRGIQRSVLFRPGPACIHHRARLPGRIYFVHHQRVRPHNQEAPPQVRHNPARLRRNPRSMRQELLFVKA